MSRPTNPSPLRLDGELTIYRAAELKQLLIDAAEQGSGDVEIDLSGVTELDSCGLQLLMLAKATAARRQRALRLLAHSPAVLEVFELLDVAAHFGDPLVMAHPETKGRP